MNLRRLLAVNIVIALFFGLSCALFPRWVLQLYGVACDAAAVSSARLVGGSILGFALLMWFGVRTASVEARRAIGWRS
jgi:uncharacterized membrane protein